MNVHRESGQDLRGRLISLKDVTQHGCVCREIIPAMRRMALTFCRRFRGILCRVIRRASNGPPRFSGSAKACSDCRSGSNRHRRDELRAAFGIAALLQDIAPHENARDRSPPARA